MATKVKVGDVYGRLTVVERVENMRTAPRFLCRCECGGEKVAYAYNLGNGNTQSCGCLHSEVTRLAKTTHGKRHTPEFYIWSGMRQRCDNPKNKAYDRYGGLGITYAPQWRDFATFYNDLGPRPSDEHTIDRIDPRGNYEPGNVRWATLEQQANNKRNSRFITLNGRTQTLGMWIKEFGLKSATVSERLRRGWSEERALTAPVHPWRQSRSE